MTKKVGPYGQGIGGTVQVVSDANAPSFDPASSTARDKRIAQLLENPRVTEWERSFLLGIYGVDRMTPKQRSVFIRISSKVSACQLE